MRRTATILVALLLVGYAGALLPHTQASGTVVDIPRIMRQPAKEVEKLVGKSKHTTKITSTPEEMPGEFRDYQIKGSKLGLTVYGMMVRYYRDAAIHATVDLPEGFETAQGALLACGINVEGSEPRIVAPVATRWVGTFNGVKFKDVAALKTGDDKTLFSSVQVTLP